MHDYLNTKILQYFSDNKIFDIVCKDGFRFTTMSILYYMDILDIKNIDTIGWIF